jgi:hypothetical protein
LKKRSRRRFLPVKYKKLWKKGVVLTWLCRYYFIPQIFINFFATQFIYTPKRKQWVFIHIFKMLLRLTLFKRCKKYRYNLSIAGKINNSRRKKNWAFRWKKNRLGLQNLHQPIKYATATGSTLVGAFGFKFWLHTKIY